jgi:hypothetical protein
LIERLTGKCLGEGVTKQNYKVAKSTAEFLIEFGCTTEHERLDDLRGDDAIDALKEGSMCPQTRA